MNTRTIILSLLVALACASTALARGGGGCFLGDTPILLADGRQVAIRDVHIGDQLAAFTSDGQIVPAAVQCVLVRQVDEYLVVATGEATLNVTPQHPFYVGNGTFKTIESLQVGDCVFGYDGSGLSPQAITSITRICRPATVYNLQTDEPHTFFADGIAVHNKGGGCFLGDTPILRADGGQMAIREVQVGDRLLAFTEAGEIVPAAVQNILTRQVDEYLVVVTEQTVLNVTPQHPFYVGNGTFKAIESLKVGDCIYAYDGSGLRPQAITRITRIHKSVTVYNLQTDQPHTFFAEGIAVHNKGGGGGFGGGGFGGGGGFHSYGGGSSGSEDSPIFFLILVGIVAVYLGFRWFGSRSGGDQDGDDENLDYLYSPAMVLAKAAKTRTLVEFIAKQDTAFSIDALTQKTTATFLKLQECWQARQYDPMKSLLIDDLYVDHCRQISNMIHQHEINVLENVAVERVDIVNVRYTNDPGHRQFTALITAHARDYYVDDRTREFIRGDRTAQKFQEFWTFQFHQGQWLLLEIEQTRESDVLKEENFFESMTDHTVDQIYGAAAGTAGPAGPWLDSSMELKATKIDRLLNFLVQTDKLWDRQAMLERARSIFMSVYHARECGDAAAVSDEELFPEVAESLRQQIQSQRAGAMSFEFRNLCIRKAELVLVRNYSDNSKDEFTVRFSAHAQQTISKAGSVVMRDEDVKPFVEYWSFGRQENQWKLKEVLPPAEGQRQMAAENVDEGSNRGQMQWFYKQTRAV